MLSCTRKRRNDPLASFFSSPLFSVTFALLFAGLCLIGPSKLQAAETENLLEIISIKSIPWENANNFCKSQGKILPSLEQLKAFQAKATDVTRYPPDSFFWANNLKDKQSKTQFAFSMREGVEKSFDQSEKNWAICANDPTAKPNAPAPKEAVGISVPGFSTGLGAASASWDNANLFCQSQNQNLPTAAQLKAVAAGTGDGSFAKYNWPKGIFWTREPAGQGHKVVSMGNGAEIWFADKDKHWAVCSDE